MERAVLTMQMDNITKEDLLQGKEKGREDTAG